MESRLVASGYYDRIGAEGLAEQAEDERTALEVEELCARLAPDDRVLDVGCGYGRIAVPLARCGVSVVGVDSSALMVASARLNAAKAGVGALFAEGDMRSLPVAGASVDAALCLWSSFNSLLYRSDQLAALKELHRVLKPGAWALIDVPDGDRDAWTLKFKGGGRDGHLIKEYFVGGGNAIYLHTTETMEALLRDSVFNDYTVERRAFGGRRRLLVELRR